MLQDAAAQHGDPMLGPSTPFGMIDRTIGIRGNQVLAGSLFVQVRTCGFVVTVVAAAARSLLIRHPPLLCTVRFCNLV
eukprot:1155366-Pelagomonas_calceolata.AAC.3